jgi:hypothetical protein
MKVSVLAASLMLAALPAFAESVRVIDGDTLEIDGVTYRLWGIDAPESANLAPTDGPQDGLPPNTCAPSSATATFPANRGPSIATAAQSRFAAPMAAI